MEKNNYINPLLLIGGGSGGEDLGNTYNQGTPDQKQNGAKKNIAVEFFSKNTDASDFDF